MKENHKAKSLFDTVKKNIEVVAAVIERADGRIYATQRGYGEWKDWWEFPGGKMEAGETQQQALVREIREELATEVAPVRFLKTISMDYPRFHLTLHCWLCHVVSGSLQLLEAEDARWLDRTHLDSLRWLPADRALLPSLQGPRPEE